VCLVGGVASTNRAWVVSSREDLPNEPRGHTRTEPSDRSFSSIHGYESSSGEDQRQGNRSGISAGNRRRERLIGQKVFGHRMRAGLGSRWRQIVRGTRGKSARGVSSSQRREHRRRHFVEPLIEQGANFLAKVAAWLSRGQFVGLERVSRKRDNRIPRMVESLRVTRRSCRGSRN